MPHAARPPLVIDFHVHMLEHEVFEASTNRTVFTGFGATPAKAPRPGAQALMGKMFDPQAILQDMDARGIDRSVVSASTVLQGTSWADAATDLKLCQRCNDQAARWVALYPNRFIGSMVLPLQAPQLAMQELERASSQLGLQVVSPDTVRHMDGQSPSAFLRRFYYDTCVYDPQVLQVLIERVGVDRLVMGSDYPVGEADPVAWLQEAGLQGDDLAAVAGGNAAKLLQRST